jgi:hypothetical protein
MIMGWLLVPLVLLVLPLTAEAQQAGKAWRIGVLGIGTPPSCQGDTPPPPMAALQRGLSDLGYVEGRNLVWVVRCPARVEDATPSAQDLVLLNPDVIVTWSNELTNAVRKLVQDPHRIHRRQRTRDARNCRELIPAGGQPLWPEQHDV